MTRLYKIEKRQFYKEEHSNNKITGNMMFSSICIPRVDITITKEYIFEKIKELKIGHIEKINEIPLRNDPNHKRIIIKFKWNYKTDHVDELKKTMTQKGSLKYVHNMPWYWRICDTRIAQC